MRIKWKGYVGNRKPKHSETKRTNGENVEANKATDKEMSPIDNFAGFDKTDKSWVR